MTKSLLIFNAGGDFFMQLIFFCSTCYFAIFAFRHLRPLPTCPRCLRFKWRDFSSSWACERCTTTITRNMCGRRQVLSKQFWAIFLSTLEIRVSVKSLKALRFIKYEMENAITNVIVLLFERVMWIQRLQWPLLILLVLVVAAMKAKLTGIQWVQVNIC